MLNHGGRLIGDFTLACRDENHFFITGAGVAEQYHMRWFEQLMSGYDVNVVPRSLDMLGLQIAGPRSRDLLQRLTRRDVSREAFKFMAFDEFDIGMIPAKVGRVSFTGSLGYEIWVRPEYLYRLFELLNEAGADLGLRSFGSRALNSMRLEKSWGSWAREYRPLYTPYEANLERFVSVQKERFIGKEALIEARDAGPKYRLTTFVVDAGEADVIADEPIWRDGEVIGWVTSGGYAHYTANSVAMGYVRAGAYDADADYEIEIIGERRPARVAGEALYDPQAERMRG